MEDQVSTYDDGEVRFSFSNPTQVSHDTLTNTTTDGQPAEGNTETDGAALPVNDSSKGVDIEQVLGILKDVVQELDTIKKSCRPAVPTQHNNVNQNGCQGDQPVSMGGPNMFPVEFQRVLQRGPSQPYIHQRPQYGRNNVPQQYGYEHYDGRHEGPRPDIGPHVDRGRFEPRDNRPRGRASYDTRSHVKIPYFTGKEDWSVWISRFEAIAYRSGWGENEMLDQLLPRIDGQAADFVFSQLPPIVLSNYNDLKDELNSRYKVIETPRLFASKFSRRCQKVGETAEEFAAELKVLYDKAHGFRDRTIRGEDLLRRFLDGLRDDDIRFEVEYNKEPRTIDDAVYQVVNFIQTRNTRDRRGKDNVRRASDDNDQINSDDECSDSNKIQSITQSQPKTRRNEPYGKDQDIKQQEKETPQKDMLELIMQRLDKLESTQTKQPYQQQRQHRDNRRECYYCHELGHFARECPKKRSPETPRESNRQTYASIEPPLNYQGPALAAKGRSQ